MSTALDPTPAAVDTLDAVRTLVPTIVARADEIEQGRRVPPDLVDALTTAGCFRMFVPRAYGGAELDLADQLAVIAELAQADGSVGWTIMIGSATPVLLGPLPRPTLDEVYADGPDVIVASAFNPTGVATPVAGGYRVTGRWAFASGCDHAHWFLAHSVVPDGRQPPVRMMLLRRSDVAIVDTWSALGLRGSGSHDFVVDDVFVPEAHGYVVGSAPSVLGPIGRIPELSISSLQFANVAIGIAQGALIEVIDLAEGKVPAFADSTLASNPLFQHRVADAEASLRAARALLQADAERAWATARAGGTFTPEHRARIRATATWITQAAAAVVDAAYTAGGGSSLYTANPLQRRLRDIHTLTQHFAVKADTFTLAGAVLLGQDADLTFL